MRESFDPMGGVRAGVGREASRLHAPIASVCLMSSRVGYSSAGWSPPEPASASPAEQKFTMKAAPQPRAFFSEWGNPA